MRKLFDQATARAELISVEAGPDHSDHDRPVITATWRLEGRVNLPLKPAIPPYVVTTKLGVGADGLIVSQLDEFDAPVSLDGIFMMLAARAVCITLAAIAVGPVACDSLQPAHTTHKA